MATRTIGGGGRPHGFTLIEMMVVIVIAGVVAAMGVSYGRGVVLNKRVWSEGKALASQLADLRTTAIANGAPAGLCLRMPSWVNTGSIANSAANSRTEFVKSSTLAGTPWWDAGYPTVTAGQANLIDTGTAALDQELDYRVLPIYGNGAGYLQYAATDTGPVTVSSATVTIMFDMNGLPSVWFGSSCESTTMTASAFNGALSTATTAFSVQISQVAGGGTTPPVCTITLLATGLVSYQ